MSRFLSRAGTGSLRGGASTGEQRRETEEYFKKEISPLIERFVAACVRHRPDDVAQFACQYFGAGKSAIDEYQVGMNGLNRQDYEICFLKPAKQVCKVSVP